MGTALGYDFSAFFGSEELADLTLLLTAAAEEDQEQQPPPAKKARGAKKATPAAVGNGNAIELPGHAMVLAGCSPVFKAQLTRWQQQPAKQRSKRPIITLQVDSLEQLEAASALARFMYQRRLPDGASQQLLVTMLQLADKYDVQMCAVACGDALSEQELEWDTVLCVLQLPAAYSEAPLFSGLFSKAAEQLHQQLGDLEESWISDERRERFLALPLKGVKLLLADKRTKVAFENTVLVAASLWVQQHSGSITSGDKRRLAQLIRLPYITPLFAAGVLPSLPWLVDALGTSTLFAAMGVGHVATYNISSGCNMTIPKDGSSVLKWPASWSMGRRPMSARKQLSMKWPVTLEEMRLVFETGQACSSTPVFFGGLDWRVDLHYSKVEAGAAHQAGEVAQSGGALSVFAKASLPSSFERSCGSIPWFIAEGSVKCARSEQGRGTNISHSYASGPVSAIDWGSGWRDFWGVGNTAQWQPEKYASFANEKGQVTLQLTISNFK